MDPKRRGEGVTKFDWTLLTTTGGLRIFIPKKEGRRVSLGKTLAISEGKS